MLSYLVGAVKIPTKIHLLPDFTKAYLIWFYDKYRDHVDLPDDIKSIINLSPVTKLDDGIIYLIQRKQ